MVRAAEALEAAMDEERQGERRDRTKSAKGEGMAINPAGVVDDRADQRGERDVGGRGDQARGGGELGEAVLREKSLRERGRTREIAAG